MNVSAVDVLAIDCELVSELLIGFMRNEVHKVGFSDVVLGLSGGVDSALTAAIAVQALGAEHVTPVLCRIAPVRRRPRTTPWRFVRPLA